MTDSTSRTGKTWLDSGLGLLLREKNNFTTAETTSILGITRPTLNVYVSKGLFTKEADPITGRPYYRRSELVSYIEKRKGMKYDEFMEDYIKAKRALDEERRKADEARKAEVLNLATVGMTAKDIIPITTCAVEPVIKNWMRDILGLSANRLLAYAYLLAATADNKAVYGSLESFGRLFGTSGQTAITVVNSLVTLDLLKCVGNSRARNATLFIPLVRNEAEALEWYRKRMGKEYGTADIFLSSERAENAPVKEGKNA